jgi:hypothetical protein
VTRRQIGSGAEASVGRVPCASLDVTLERRMLASRHAAGHEAADGDL